MGRRTARPYSLHKVLLFFFSNRLM